MGLPMALNTAMHDMMCGACISLNLCPLLSQGQIEALEHHANADIQALYLPKLISGEWTGTMNLTEPHAGSDVGALSTKAEPQADGSYKIAGQKIFITWGEHDVAENICHLVLARLPGAKPGPKGISLFLVPKFIPNADGSLGARNDLRCVSLEHKLGIHGSPTAVMEFSGATGWLVGEEHNGMACMFTMMNNARLAVGMQGVGVAEGAYQHALAYAMDRKQGRSPIADGTGTIIDHADVRRMLAQMKADIFAARSIGVACAVAIDMAKGHGRCRLADTRGVFDTHCQIFWQRHRRGRGRSRGANSRRHGFCRGNRSGAISARRADHPDLRRHQWYSIYGSCCAQDDGWGGRSLCFDG